MDFAWTEEQLSLKNAYIEFAQRELNQDLVGRDQDSVFSHEAWKKAADFGVQALPVPAKYGGREDTDILTAMLAMEGLGYGSRDNGLALGLNAQMWTVQLPIVMYGSEAQKEKFLPGLADGSLIGAHAITEQDAGSDVFSMQTTAEKRDGGYVLNGVKKFTSLGPVADLALVFASTNLELGKWGITAFLVERNFEGYTAGPNESKMGLRTVPLGEIELKDCFVPLENRLGPEGAGRSISTSSLEYERVSILSSQIGAMERQLEETISYAQERQQFGRPIGKFQSVSNRIVEMKLRLETARLLLYKAAWLKKMDKPAMLEAAMVKLHLSEGFLESGLDAVRVHGGLGYLTGTEVERDLRDAVGGIIYAGTSDIQRTIIARMLGL